MVLIIWGLWKGWLELPSRRLVLTAAGIIAAITVHSALLLLLSTGVNVEWMVKESSKLILVVVLVGCLLILFQGKELRNPPNAVVAPLLVIAIPAIVLLSQFEPILVTRTVYAVTLAGLVLLLGQDDKWQRSPKARWGLTLACLAVMVTAILLHNKGVAGMALAMTAWIAFGYRLSGATSAWATIILSAFVLSLVSG